MSNNILEWCPYCDREENLREEFVPQVCSCGQVIFPCSICKQLIEENRCEPCPLDADAIYLTEEARQKLNDYKESAVYALDFSKYIGPAESEPVELRFKIVERTDCNDNIILILKKDKYKLSVDEFISCIKDI